MVIYGTALLSICLLAGLIVGEFLGVMLHVEANVGGVGIAMLLLIVVCERLQRAGRLRPPTDSGIVFWSSIYIPVVVAMAASQNVIAAAHGGAMAIVAGVLVVIASFAMVPLISRVGAPPSDSPEADSLPPNED